jgi:hypothetical protein
MEIEKQEYIHIKMHKSEAEKFVMLLDELKHSSNSAPDWAKAQAIEVRRKFEALGI